MLQILSMAKRIGYELLNNISNSNTWNCCCIEVDQGA
jgi:hypothetical protein